MPGPNVTKKELETEGFCDGLRPRETFLWTVISKTRLTDNQVNKRLIRSGNISAAKSLQTSDSDD